MTQPSRDQNVWRDEEEMVAAICEVYPDTDRQNLRFHRSGWDSVAIETAGRLFKFPRQTNALAALRREVDILALVRPLSPLPVPDMRLHGHPAPFSEHLVLPGEHLVTAQYERLSEARRDRLAAALADFYAAIHAIDPAAARAAGAVPVEAWLPAQTVDKIALPLLPVHVRAEARQIVDVHAATASAEPDEIYGFFDGHGWNMAFDHATGTLNGIYDFADSGIGQRHQEFVYSSFISWDLTERIIGHYEGVTGLSIDRKRVRTLTGYHRLWELAVCAQSGNSTEIEEMLTSALSWLERP